MRRLLILLLIGCVDDPSAGPGPRIEAVAPDPVDPGGLLTLEGEAFGAFGQGAVAVGGRPASVQSWSGSRVTVLVPEDAPGGATYVVLTAAGQPSAPEPIFVTGSQGPVEGRRQFPDGADGGVRPRPDGALDAGPDANTTLVAEYLSDPANNDAIRITQLPDDPGFITLRVQGPQGFWGVAYHLAYDRNLLRFQGVTPALSQQHHVAEIGAGRVAAGRVMDDARATEITTLRFRVVGRGEGRVDFPRRHRQARIAPNNPVPDMRWIGGSVRVQAR